MQSDTEFVIEQLQMCKAWISSRLKRGHKNCRCMLCEMVPMELGKIIDALEKD